MAQTKFKPVEEQLAYLKKGVAEIIREEDLKAKLDSGEDVMVVDVRHRVEFESEPTIIPGALHVMIEELEARQQEVPRDRDIVLYCT